MVPERRVFSECLRITDVLVMLFALGLGLFLTQQNAQGFEPLEFLSRKISPVNMVLLAFLCLLWPVLLDELGLSRPWNLRSFRAEVVAIFKGISFGAIVLLLMVVLFQRQNVTPMTIAYFWLFAMVGTVLVHLAFHGVAVNLRSVATRQVLIVGSGPRARRLAKSLEELKDVTGYRLLGFVDDQSTGDFRDGVQLISTILELPAFLKENVVDEVIVTLPMKSKYQSILDVSTICEEQGIPIRIPSDLFELRISNRSVSDLGLGEPLLTFYTGTPPKPWSLAAKRVLDMLGSATVLVVFSPVFLATALAVKLSSPGPIFFKQERLGVNKRRFQVFKFRTMVQDAELLQADLEALNEVDFPAFKLKLDPRITPIGGFLRRTSIDELPQLFNVLRGEMSLVGPRPLAVRDAMGISENWQKRRFSVKPGITCLWQINGRSNVRFQEWMRMDLEYIDNWSLGLDLTILVKTIPAVLRGEGAA
jgi:exopolysaccharide biosynthesis polyprenyl glycosylphosphotransferase